MEDGVLRAAGHADLSELRQRRVSPGEVLGVLNREVSLILKY